MVKKSCLVLLAILLLAVSLSACSRSAETTTPAATVTTTQPATTNVLPATTTPAATSAVPETITITDDYGRTVTIKKFPMRIISLSPANTEILFALGLGDRIVGVSEYSDYPEAAKSKPSVGSYNEPNIEQIIALEPDLILATEEHQTAITQLESKGFTVVGVNPESVAEVLGVITLLGKLTGKEVTAAWLVSNLQSRIDAITSRTAALTDVQKPRVFLVIWHDPIWTVGANTFHDELIKIAGGVNIAADMDGYSDISIENVIDRNPQIIIAGVGMGTGSDASLVAMQTDGRLASTEARINDKVYGSDMDIISRPGPRLIQALEELFKLIHPEMQ